MSTRFLIIFGLIALILVIVIPIAIDWAYTLGDSHAFFYTQFYPSDLLAYIGGALAFLATTFLTLLAIHISRKLYKEQVLKEERITKRDTYVYLVPKYVGIIKQSLSTMKTPLSMSESSALGNATNSVGLVFQLRMKASREAVVDNVEISQFKFSIEDKGHYVTNTSYKTKPYRANIKLQRWFCSDEVDHELEFSVHLSTIHSFNYNDINSGKITINLEICYINSFNVKVECKQVIVVLKRLDASSLHRVEELKSYTSDIVIM
ncbi:MAG: hypothetical protein FWC73_04380 [Defluviitaleaceae bacterium]|nr:hypothetical protein [Defluviitaleaceae bacterium]